MALVAGGLMAASGWMAASDRGQDPRGPGPQPDEFTITVPVSSAEHETIEGYFSLGDSTTVMVKPGSDLFRFLVRQRGKKVRLTITREERPEQSKLVREP